jgi:hypothetical protein
MCTLRPVFGMGVVNKACALPGCLALYPEDLLGKAPKSQVYL